MTFHDYSMAQIFKILIIPALGQTLFMLFIAGFFSIFIGSIIGTILYVTDSRGVHPNKTIFTIFDVYVNIVRSFPFTILVVAIIPLTRLIIGTSIGSQAALIPLIIANSAFMSRIFQNSLNETDPSLIEAGRAFGLKNTQIVTKISFVEAVPSLISGISLGLVTLLSQTAAAGAVGAGGLGATAITYGYQSFNDKVMYSIVIILIILVAIIQMISSYLYKKSK